MRADAMPSQTRAYKSSTRDGAGGEVQVAVKIQTVLPGLTASAAKIRILEGEMAGA